MALRGREVTAEKSATLLPVALGGSDRFGETHARFEATELPGLRRHGCIWTTFDSYARKKSQLEVV